MGLTSILSIYMLSLQWVEEIRVDLTALQTGRAVLADAGILTDKNNDPILPGPSNLDAVAKGWLNDYFVVRRIDAADVVNLPKGAGKYVTVHIQVYYGGDDQDGVLAHDFYFDQIIPGEYNP